MYGHTYVHIFSVRQLFAQKSTKHHLNMAGQQWSFHAMPYYTCGEKSLFIYIHIYCMKNVYIWMLICDIFLATVYFSFYLQNNIHGMHTKSLLLTIICIHNGISIRIYIYLFGRYLSIYLYIFCANISCISFHFGLHSLCAWI